MRVNIAGKRTFWPNDSGRRCQVSRCARDELSMSDLLNDDMLNDKGYCGIMLCLPATYFMCPPSHGNVCQTHLCIPITIARYFGQVLAMPQ